MLSFIKEKYQCTGCGACLNICPKDCITLIEDEEGFLYPSANDDCINCNKCYNVCPIAESEKEENTSFNQFSVAAISKNDDIWNKSTSGGAFTEICNAFCKDDDIIFGAKFRENKVVHDFVYGAKNINCFRKSKYVQSDLLDNYINVKKFLKEGKKVVFSGTPCQVKGLRNFLANDYENLLCVDLICHGVGSPGIFRKYLEHLEYKTSKKIESYEFRNKEIKLGKIYEYNVKIKLEDRKIFKDNSDLYSLGFLQGLFLRPACYKCKFTNLNRCGDITIGDLKNRYKLVPEAKGLKNLSTIIINNKKGNQVYEEIIKNMDIYPVNINDMKYSNSPLNKPSNVSDKRESFFKSLTDGNDIEQAIISNITKPNMAKKIWLKIPDKIRFNIKEAIGCKKK